MSTLDISIRPVSPVLGAECSGVDLRAEFNDDVKQRLRAAWHEYGLVLFRGQELDESNIQRAASIFGEISTRGAWEYDVVENVSSTAANEGFGLGPLAFHSDHSFEDEPLSGIMLYAVEVPPPNVGGETLFSSMKLAYQKMPASLRTRIDSLSVRHGIPDKTKAQTDLNAPVELVPDAPQSVHPLVMSHPATGEKFLFMSRRHVVCIEGLSLADSNALIADLLDYIQDPEIVYTHSWLPGDLVVWDNLSIQHARTGFDHTRYNRNLRRLQIA